MGQNQDNGYNLYCINTLQSSTSKSWWSNVLQSCSGIFLWNILGGTWARGMKFCRNNSITVLRKEDLGIGEDRNDIVRSSTSAEFHLFFCIRRNLDAVVGFANLIFCSCQRISTAVPALLLVLSCNLWRKYGLENSVMGWLWSGKVQIEIIFTFAWLKMVKVYAVPLTRPVRWYI